MTADRMRSLIATLQSDDQDYQFWRIVSTVLMMLIIAIAYECNSIAFILFGLGIGIIPTHCYLQSRMCRKEIKRLNADVFLLETKHLDHTLMG